MIWGLTLEPGKDYTQLVQDEVQLSMATMESRGCIGSKDEKYSHLMMKTNTAEYMLCTLVSGITYQQGLDLKLMPNDEVTFTVQGTNTVYLTGYSYMSMEVDDEQQPEDWIEEPEDTLPEDSREYIADDGDPYHPSADQETERQKVEGDISISNEEEKYAVLLEADVRRQHQQEQPLPPPQQQTRDIPALVPPVTQSDPGEMSSHSLAPGQSDQQSTDVLSVSIKSEIHPVVEIEQAAMNQPLANEDHVELRGHPTNLPSTSRGHQPRHSLTPPHAYPALGNNYSDKRNGDPRVYRQQLNSVLGSNPLNLLSVQQHWNNAPVKSYHGNRNIPQNVQSLRQNSSIATTSGIQVRSGSTPGLAWGTQPPQNAPQATGGPGEMHFKCSFCSKLFYTLGSRKRHEGTHTGERPFSCRHCLKSFRTQDSLRKHERIHTGERPYTCDLCGKTFIQNSHLHVHLRKFHNKVAWKPKN